MKKTGIILSLLLAVSVAATGCSSGSTASSGVSGTYTGSAKGNVGNVSVEVTLENSVITDVKVTECKDGPEAIAGAAVNTVTQEIIDAQSYNVDVAAGATFTSAAIKNAVKEALTEAGVADSFAAKAEETEITEGEDITCDVVVVGGGGSGIMAALNAKYPNLVGEDNGLSVIVVEKLSYIGGGSMLSGGWIDAGVPLNDETNFSDEELVEGYYATSTSRLEDGTFDDTQKEAQLAKLKMSNTMLDNMLKTGLQAPSDGLYEDASTYSSLAQWVVTNPEPEENWSEKGIAIRYYFDSMLQDRDIDVRLNTTGESLIVEDGEIKGITVTDKTSTYNIYAKKVILATGGMSNSLDLLKEFYPDDAGTQTFTVKGDTGDAITMLRNAGYDIDVVADRIMGYMGLNSNYGYTNPFKADFMRAGLSTVMVNTSGERFANDGAGWSSQVMYNTLVKQDGKIAYQIIDSRSEGAAVCEENLEEYAGLVFKADTIEELAEEIGVDARTLSDTITKYNDAYNNGTEDEFGVANESMAPVEEGPFYAVTIRPMILATYGGVVVNGEFEVVSGDSTIDNVYVVGEATYTGSFASLADSLWSGSIAGLEAQADILG